MNIILTTLNAKFIHSSLALRCLKKSAGIYERYVKIVEYSINNSLARIEAELYRKKPDVLCFSCYIWNIEDIKTLLSNLKKVLPHTVFLLGGPEATFMYKELLLSDLCDIVILGEGEGTFFELTEHFIKGSPKDKMNTGLLGKIKGLAYKNEQGIVLTDERPLLDLNALPFVYEDGFDELENKIIYYESSRGCPFSCSYCLSSIKRAVRFLSLERLFAELTFFLEHRVTQVKFVDRSFNCDLPRAKKIWSFLIDNDNGVTNFHFEIQAAILDAEAVNILKEARRGLFRFEIGVQTTNPPTLKAINRADEQEKLLWAINKLKMNGNIHLHLDLIAGLPLEDIKAFEKSFNDVYALEPDQLQLGFLKVLKGAPIEKHLSLYGIVHEDKPPYTVMYNNALSYADLLRLKDIEEVLDMFYNSGKFLFTFKFLGLQRAKTADSNALNFYSALSDYLKSLDFFDTAHNVRELYSVFYDFCAVHFPDAISVLKELLIFDIYYNEQAKSLPDFADEQNHAHIIKDFFAEEKNIEARIKSKADYTPKQLSRLCALRKFTCDMIKLTETGEVIEEDCFIMFVPKKLASGEAFYFETGR